MNFVYCKTKKDAINYDIFLHIIYISAERTRLELVTTCVTGRDSNQTELTFQSQTKFRRKSHSALWRTRTFPPNFA